MTIAIHAEHLSKTYFLPEEGAMPPRHLRDAITNQLKRYLLAREPQRMREFKALDDVSFTIHEGERVGLMGDNGAGKSTLIRLLAGITKPTTGRAEITGRVATLLELGLGFHDELSGRENIYMMGALYGMEKSEITAQFDEIVDFAGISEFLRTPLKHYSTGMRARLGFAVAANLRSDILLIDEALSVGDAKFQAKSLAKMREVSRGGRTVVLVSHSPGMIQEFCSRMLVLDHGKLIEDRPVMGDANPAGFASHEPAELRLM